MGELARDEVSGSSTGAHAFMLTPGYNSQHGQFEQRLEK